MWGSSSSQGFAKCAWEGFQYLTQGVIRSLMGANLSGMQVQHCHPEFQSGYFMYLNCITAPGQAEDNCATNGPGSVAPTALVLAPISELECFCYEMAFCLI